MKKYLFMALCKIFVCSLNVSAQEPEVSGSRTRPSGQQVFKIHNNPKQDKTDQFDIQGLGGTTFTASNTVDGSVNSYKHSLQIVLTLIPSKGGNNFQLNFYSPGDNIQQAASYTDGTLNIYYPVAVYEDIRTKLEQALATKKKVIVKVIQKTNGYREGTLIL
ncbi:MAG: hypothetical protein ABI688_03875 [Bacteroidota bacterium]